MIRFNGQRLNQKEWRVANVSLPARLTFFERHNMTFDLSQLRLELENCTDRRGSFSPTPSIFSLNRLEKDSMNISFTAKRPRYLSSRSFSKHQPQKYQQHLDYLIILLFCLSIIVFPQVVKFIFRSQRHSFVWRKQNHPQRLQCIAIDKALEINSSRSVSARSSPKTDLPDNSVQTIQVVGVEVEQLMNELPSSDKDEAWAMFFANIYTD